MKEFFKVRNCCLCLEVFLMYSNNLSFWSNYFCLYVFCITSLTSFLTTVNWNGGSEILYLPLMGKINPIANSLNILKNMYHIFVCDYTFIKCWMANLEDEKPVIWFYKYSLTFRLCMAVAPMPLNISEWVLHSEKDSLGYYVFGITNNWYIQLPISRPVYSCFRYFS